MTALIFLLGYFVMAIVTGRICYLFWESFRDSVNFGFWDGPLPFFTMLFWPLAIVCAIVVMLITPIVSLVQNGPMYYLRGSKPHTSRHQRKVAKKKLAIAQAKELSKLEEELARERAIAEKDWDKQFENLK